MVVLLVFLALGPFATERYEFPMKDLSTCLEAVALLKPSPRFRYSCEAGK